nr:MAG TPA: hypothetical protein [Caudoviricetes sp.]
MSRPGNRAVLYEGSPALRELIETYATMDVKAYCAKWGLAIATVRSTASRRGLLRQRGKVRKNDTANIVKPTSRRGRKPKALVTPPPPPAPAYEPPADMIPPNVLKHTRGYRKRSWKDLVSRRELNTMPVPYPFSEIADAPYNRGLDETPEETGRVVKRTKNR